MRRNVAGQFVGIQLVSKTDGSAVTSGTTTVYVTGDAGTQAAGSVGSGACTHEGNGFWTYAPAQAETNYTHVAFTFVNTNAINATLQIYPISYDASGQMTGVTVGTNSDKTGYSLTATTGLGDQTANITGNLSGSVGSVTGAVGSVTGNVGGNVTGSVGSVAAGGITAASIATGAIDADALATDAVNEIVDQVWREAIADHSGTAGSTAEALNNAGAAANPWTDTLVTYVAGQAGYLLLNNLNATVSSRASQTSLDTLDDYVDTEVAAIKAKTDNLPAAPAAVGDIPTATQNADALLNRDMSAVSDTNSRSPLNALRFLRNKWDVAATTLTVKKEDDTTTAWTATVSTNASAEPIIGNDPA